jgi:hypothetical protein
MPDLQSLLRSPYIFLIVGVITLSAAVASTWTGKTRVRFVPGWVYRAKDPNDFWWVVAIYYFSGVLFIVIFWYWVT